VRMISKFTAAAIFLIVGVFHSSVFAQTPLPFLSRFPLDNRGPFSAVINSVFDHSYSSEPGKNEPFCPNSVVTAFTGETGRKEFGAVTVVLNGFSCGGPLQSFRQDSQGTEFTLGDATYNSNKDDFLAYDGHPGYDYRTRDPDQDPNNGRVAVHAAAAGRVVCVSLRTANGALMQRVENDLGQCSSPNFGEIKIDHGNGYFTIYLHLSSAEVHGPRSGLLGDTVVAGQQIATSGETGAPGAPHLHFEVRRNIGGGVLVPVDPYGWHGAGTDPYTRAVNVNLWSTLLGDLNRDGVINSLDWSLMSANWLTNNAVADLNNDEIVNSLDFSLMNANWLRRAPR
jgi:Peptidase family M23/Dockerin type I domain